MMSGIGGAFALGRMLGAALGAFIYNQSGSFVLTCIVAAVIGFGAFFLMWRYIQEQHEQTPVEAL
jgi:predicted MFS family arabinose efflux permease